MTNAAVAEPAATPDSQGAIPASDTQAPTPLTSGDAPNGANGGTDGAQSSEQATTLQTGDEQAKPEAASTPTPPATPVETDEQREQRIRNKIQADQEADARREALTKTQNELRALRREGGEIARDLLNKIEEHTDVRLPAELRKPVLDWVETLNGKALDAAKLELGDNNQSAVDGARNELLAEIVRGIYSTVPKEDLPAFQAATKGKPIEEWVTQARRFGGDASVKTAAVTEDRTAHDEALSSLIKDDAINSETGKPIKDELAAALKAAKTPKARAEAYETAFTAAERARPAPAPRGEERKGGGSGPSNLEDARLMHAGMHPSGQTITTAQMRTFRSTGHT